MSEACLKGAIFCAQEVSGFCSVRGREVAVYNESTRIVRGLDKLQWGWVMFKKGRIVGRE